MYTQGTYTISSRDVDGTGQCRPSAVLGMMQEWATVAGNELGLSRKVMKDEYNAVFILAKNWYQLDKPIYWNDEITVKTWHRGTKGVVLYRDFDFYRNGERVGQAVSAWVLVDWQSHKLLRVSHIASLEENHGGDLRKDKTLGKIRPPMELASCGSRIMAYSDSDINGHVNNTRYADFACDGLHLEDLNQGKFLAELEVSYSKESYPKDILNFHAGENQGKYYFRGLGETGETRFDVCFVMKSLDKGQVVD